ncbi:MAG TPA: endolytic transglycosylase MltG [Flavobacteriales bacterium]|jgi:UPF0755 protein|nr:endolytic transglycosylase MltG [Flavobacteriales bacterium]
MTKIAFLTDMASRKVARIRRWVFILLLTSIGIGGSWAYKYYQFIYASNVSISEGTRYVLLPGGVDFEGVQTALLQDGLLEDLESFIWVAERKNYPSKVKAGRYLLSDGMSNNSLVNLLRSGEQQPLTLTLNNMRFTEDLASLAGAKLEFDSSDLMNLLTDRTYLNSIGFDPIRVKALFIPNTYEFYWSTTADEFIDRMAVEYKKFWNDARKSKAKALGLTQTEVSTLASIVEKETLVREEKPRVAGLYLNRIRRGIKLQADPTVIYALGDFTVNRVLREHLKIDNPYNTYMYKGLPPGPICIPEPSSIDAVLNPEKHNYIFMCAKADFSGYHSFATNLREHNRNARAYQRALNERKIFK